MIAFSHPFVGIALALSVCLAAQAPLAPPPPEIGLAADSDPVRLSEFGLGDGGFIAAARAGLRFGDGDSVLTPGGARVDCRSVGVKVTFPSGRELLVAPDGVVHLRSGETAGPFPSGLELRLGDGAAVRISLSPSSRERLRDVVLVDRDRALQPWRRGEAATATPRPAPWAGLRISCCGDGGELYRTIALGPLLVLDRLLVEKERADAAPRQRLVVLAAPLVQSLATMRQQHREPDAAVRQAVTAIAAVADRGRTIFAAGASLTRVEPRRLRWHLSAGFELQIDLDGVQAPRLQLFAGGSGRPMVEWTLNADAAAFLSNPRDDHVEKRWHGNGTRLPRVAVDLQAKAELFERGYALQIIERLRR